MNLANHQYRSGCSPQFGRMPHRWASSQGTLLLCMFALCLLSPSTSDPDLAPSAKGGGAGGASSGTLPDEDGQEYVLIADIPRLQQQEAAQRATRRAKAASPCSGPSHTCGAAEVGDGGRGGQPAEGAGQGIGATPGGSTLLSGRKAVRSGERDAEGRRRRSGRASLAERMWVHCVGAPRYVAQRRAWTLSFC